MNEKTSQNDPRDESILTNSSTALFLPASHRLKTSIEQILRAFEIASRLQLPAAQYLDSKSFIDSLPKFLDSLIKALTLSEPERRSQHREYEIARKHGEQRSEFPVYDLNQLLLEYDILRKVLFDILEQEEQLSTLERDIILEALQIAMRSSTDEFIRLRSQKEMMSQDQLRHSEKLLKLAIRGGNLGIWAIRFPGNNLIVDEMTKELHGVQPGDDALDVIHRQVHPDDQNRVKAALDDGINNGSVLRIDYRVRNSTGTYRWASNRGEPEYDVNGTLISFSGVIADITEQKNAEAQLRLEQHKLEAIFEQSPAAMAMWRGPQLIFEKVNPNYQAIYKHRRLEGLPLTLALPELKDQLFPTLLKKVFDTGEPFIGKEVLARIARTDGGPLEDRYYDFAYVRINDPSGNPYGVFDHAIDVTERRLSHQKLEESERQLKAYAEAMPQMAFVADNQGHILYFNQRFYDYTGLRPGVVEGWDWKDHPLHHPDDLQRTIKTWQDSIRTGRPYQIEYRLKRADGQYRWHLGRAVASRDQTGQIVRWYGTNTDIHEQKLLTEELEIAKVTAERANTTKSAFLANMSHEIRTPLGAILGFTDLMRDPNLTQHERNHFLDTIDRNGKALTRIIDDILDLAKVEAGKMDVENIQFSFLDLLDDVMDLFRERAKAKGLYLKMFVDSQVPIKICTDPTRLRQIFINIIGNALKFTETGGITIRVKADLSVSGHYHFTVIVKDSGIGIPPEKRERLFQPFAQADNTTTRKFGGTGLGLVLSYRLAKALGGDIKIKECAPPTDQGCVFEITFLAAKPLDSGDNTSDVAPSLLPQS